MSTAQSALLWLATLVAVGGASVTLALSRIALRRHRTFTALIERVEADQAAVAGRLQAERDRLEQHRTPQER